LFHKVGDATEQNTGEFGVRPDNNRNEARGKLTVKLDRDIPLALQKHFMPISLQSL
jgi:hypothetical protein